MTRPITGLDHCIILVRDLDAARARIERLGFRCAPRGVHSAHMGTHNHCVMLERGYFEVLAILAPTAHNQRWRERLAEREGLAGIALATHDARAAHAAFRAAGIDAPEAVDFARPVDLPSGPTEARFTVAQLPVEATPGAGMFVCQHHTPEAVWLPDLLAQPNGATALHGLTLVGTAPQAWQHAYGRVFGAAAVRAGTQSLHIDTGAGSIDVLAPAGLAARYPALAARADTALPYIAALTLECADPAATRAYLQGRGVRVSASSRGGVCVGADEACGVVLEFLPRA